MPHKTIIYNESKMNFDGKLDFSILSPEVITYSDTTPEQFLERAAGAEILLLVICALRAPKRKSDLAKIVCL